MRSYFLEILEGAVLIFIETAEKVLMILVWDEFKGTPFAFYAFFGLAFAQKLFVSFGAIEKIVELLSANLGCF